LKEHSFTEQITVTHTVYALKPDVSSGDVMIRYSDVHECSRCKRPFEPLDSVGVAFMSGENNWALCTKCFHTMAAHYPEIVIKKEVAQ
jgi:5-methylcytosine-specific restriction endonuclease McrA